jgi:hypothetical protein
MPVPVTDYISTTAPSDTFATHDSTLGKGGWREVASNAARDAITTERRSEGMAVFTRDTGTLWVLAADLLTWNEFAGGGGGATALTLEAGENLTAGTPVKVSANKVYAANAAVDPGVIGLIKTDVLSTFMAEIVNTGNMTLAGLSAGSPYFVGNGTISLTPPSSGYVIRVGTAVKSDTLVVNIEEPILLA